MAGERFKVGDTVQLKSGGPIMTVDEEHDDDSVTCQWFLKQEVKMGVFKQAALQRYTAPQGGSAQTRVQW